MWATLQPPQSQNSNRRGFTIVELLIVVVVIAILAAITIVAYNGIQNRAKASAAQSAASQTAKKLAAYIVTHGDLFPDEITDSDLGLTSTNSSYQYRVASDKKSYCATVTTQGLSYFVSNTNLTPTLGVCSGHGLNGVSPITNLVVNPSVELSASGYNANNVSSTAARSTLSNYSGTASLLVTSLNTTNGYNGVNRAAPVVAGKTYTFSAWVYLNSAYGLGVAATTNGAGTTVKQGNLITTLGSWQRTSVTFTPTTTGNATIYVITPSGSTVPANASFYTDAWTFTEGTDTYQYADGETPGWLWDNGSPHASSSTGSPSP